MNPIQIVLVGVTTAIELALTLINALSKTEAERQAHLADLKGRLKLDVADVHSTAEEAKQIVDSLPVNPHG